VVAAGLEVTADGRLAVTAQTVEAVMADGNGVVPLLELHNLVKEFPVTSGAILQRKVAAVHAVSDVSFSVPAGTTFVSCASTSGGLCGGSGNHRAVSFPSLAANASATITLVADVPCSVASGTVLSNTATRHTAAEFVAFLADIVVHQPRGKEIHVIADNLSAHKTGQVDEFLERHLNVHLHFTPTYSSWLNQIELWFAKIERAVIARGIFTSVADLKRKLMRYIRQYNRAPKPVKWVYRNPAHRITTDSRVTVH